MRSGRILGGILVVAALSALMVNSAQAQRGGSGLRAAQRGAPGADGGFRGFGGAFNSSLSLLQNERVQQELEIVGDQLDELNALQEEVRQSMRDMFANFRELSDSEREAAQEKLAEKTKEIEGEVNQILLPHQQRRLEQLAVQSQGRFGGTVGSLTSGNVAEKLGITEAQQEQLREKAEEAQRKFDEKVAKLREDMEDEILGVLSAEQRKKYQELVGDRFDFGGFGRGQRGGRGGEGDRGRNGGGGNN